MYKLINKQTGEEHICQKVTIDGFDYYVSDEKVHFGYVWNSILEQVETMFEEKTFHNSLKGIIATTNHSLMCPKVVDEVERLANQKALPHLRAVFIEGYNKSQETHPFTEEDMIEFANFHFRQEFNATPITTKTTKELFEIWKEQQPKIVYYV